MRSLFTGGFSSGLVALGERNSYAFPMRWVTVDWSDADFSFWLSKESRLPFADNSQDVVYTAHMLEHVENETLSHLLSEINRVLRPGGAVRIEVPDAERLLAAYTGNDRAVLDYFRADRAEMIRKIPSLDDKYLEDHLTVLGEISNYIDYAGSGTHIPVYASKDEFDRHLSGGLEAINEWGQGLKTPEQRKTGGHANALSFDKLDRMLRAAGFSKVWRTSIGKTNISRLRLGRGWRRLFDSVPETESRAFYSLHIEAQK